MEVTNPEPKAARIAHRDEVTFSLVLATLHRTTELSRFLSSLNVSDHRRIEVIVVDQNPDDRLVALLAPFENSLTIKHVRTDKRGLSRARNLGLTYVTGDIVAFPDDDCWYEEDTLAVVAQTLLDVPQLGGVTGLIVDDEDPNAYSWYERESCSIDRRTVWKRATSATIFLRQSVVAKVGLFDEGLGVGAETGRIAAEEMDYLIRSLDSGCMLHLNSDIRVFHRGQRQIVDKTAMARGFGYSLGIGHVLRKHHFEFLQVAIFLLRPLGGALLFGCCCNLMRAKYHFAMFKGRLYGWLGIQ